MLTQKERISVPDRYNYFELAGKWLVELYVAWGKADKAAEWRKKQNR